MTRTVRKKGPERLAPGAWRRIARVPLRPRRPRGRKSTTGMEREGVCTETRAARGVVRALDSYDAPGRRSEIVRRHGEQNTITVRESGAFYAVTTWEPRTM
jgi:hypothetical protein